MKKLIMLSSLFFVVNAFAKPYECNSINLDKACIVKYVDGTFSAGICVLIDDSPSCEIPPSCGKLTIGLACIVSYTDGDFEAGKCMMINDSPSCEIPKKN